MAIFEFIDQVHNGTTYDIYHPQTDQKAVKVIGDADAILGTLNEYVFSGKTVVSGAVTDLKVSGLYFAKGLTGMPTGVLASDEVLLIVRAVNKTIFYYQAIIPDGSIMSKTVIKGKPSEWSSGGTSLQNTIGKIISEFGSLANLKTSSKSSLVSAINEVVDDGSATSNKLNIHIRNYNEFQQHKHDADYVKLGGISELNGSVTLSSAGGITLRQANAGLDNVLSINNRNEIVLGNTGTPMNLQSKNELLHNGKKVWTEVNDGSGSGLDADMLHGVDGQSYARRDAGNTFTSTQAFNEVIIAKKGVTLTNGSINQDASSRLVVKLGGKTAMTVDTAGKVDASNLDLTASASDTMVRLKQGVSSAGIGLNLDKTSGLFQLYNWESGGGSVMKVEKNSAVADFSKHIVTQGRALYLQSTRPTGSSHPVGSIWFS